ncbi:hypothetical protein CCH79_00020962, partial [Gambusia affinis]
MERQVLFSILLCCVCSALGQISYSVPEEMPKGSVVGNIAIDLGLDVKRLQSGKARIFTGESAEYVELSRERGVLLVKEKIDRELLCRQTTPCALHLQIILENPMELFRITVEITDINDNSPSFKNGEKRFEISESAVTGSKFVLEKAVDLDIGRNDSELDRETASEYNITVTCSDGGIPSLSSSVTLTLKISDVNDNMPVFERSSYEAYIVENNKP